MDSEADLEGVPHYGTIEEGNPLVPADQNQQNVSPKSQNIGSLVKILNSFCSSHTKIISIINCHFR